jgi:hypothetical protein
MDESFGEKKSEVKSEKGSNLMEKIRNNPWMLSTFVLGIAVVLLLIFYSSGSMTGNVVAGSVAGESLVEFLNTQADSEVTLENVAEESGLYKVDVGYQGEVIPLYTTKDGKYFVQGVVPLTGQEASNTESSSSQPSSSYSEEDLILIADFMTCLAGKNVKIYGANWCGYTKQLVENLGGFDVVSPIYVECTEEDALCAEEEVQGYPTIKIDGEVVNIERTLEGFAEATGCSAPVLSGEVSTSSSEVQC